MCILPHCRALSAWGLGKDTNTMAVTPPIEAPIRSPSFHQTGTTQVAFSRSALRECALHVWIGQRHSSNSRRMIANKDLGGTDERQ
jgi:hypothetical protein